MALGDLTATVAKLAKDRPVSLFWIDVNRASHLFGYRIRNQANVNGEVRITVALNAWLERLANARPPQLTLSGTGGDEVLIVDQGEDIEASLAAVSRLIEAGQAPSIYEGVSPRVTLACEPLTMACGGLRTVPGAAGHELLGDLLSNVRQAKVIGSQGRLHSVLCFMGRPIAIRHPDDDPEAED
jgi:hypothetical protein